jgi:3-oxoacyl-[acyl-carrier-protein] synthase II
MIGPGRKPEAVVITGVAAVSPVGSTFAEIATNLLAGRSGVRTIAAAASAAPTTFAAAVDEIPRPPANTCRLHREAFDRLDRLERVCLVPAAAALADAGLTPAACDPDRGSARAGGPRIGLVLGSGAEHLRRWELDFAGGGTEVLAPRPEPSLAGRMREWLGITGPAITVAAACGSSGYALAVARAWLRDDLADVVVAGGCDILSPTSLAAFHNLRALSRRSDDPARASRPFDRDRDGFVMGEGGGFLVLERQADAAARGAGVRGELAGVGMSSDGVHMVTPSVDPSEAARAIAAALTDAGVEPHEVDYVNAHAAGTPVGDVAEAGAIRLAFGPATDGVPVSSTKSMSGHLVSGAAAFEAVACLVALERQAVPPTVNLDAVDPRCPLDHVPHVARPRRVRVAASNSFGFGGSNICLVIRRAA